MYRTYGTLQIIPLLKKMLLHITISPSLSFALQFKNLILNVLKEMLGIKKNIWWKRIFNKCK